MSFLDYNGTSEFPMSKESVFQAMQKAIPTIKGFRIKNIDKLQGRLTVSAGVSWFSWGENIPIQLIEVAENRTQVQIVSSPKTGILFGGLFDMGKNRKNIENILAATSRVLSEDQQNFPQNQSQQNSSYSSATQPSNFVNNNPNSSAWYEQTWLVVVLCFVFMPVGVYALWKNSSITKAWKIIVTVILGLLTILMLKNMGSSSPTATAKENTTSTERAENPKEKQWTSIYSFSGNGIKKSSVFELTGGEARIKYTYKATRGAFFTVYVVNEGEDILKTGGVPEVMTRAKDENSETSLQKTEGRYYLNVVATGDWQVTVEELK